MSVESIVTNDIELMKMAKKNLINATNPKDGWQHMADMPYSDIKVYVKEDSNGCCCVAGHGIVIAPINKILDAIRDQKNWQKMDNMLESSEFIELTPNSRIIHLTFKSLMSIISKRDVVFVENVYREKDNVLVVSTKTNLDLYPSKDANCVRADLKSGGWYIVPIDEKSCKVTYYANVDFKLEYINSSIMKLLTLKVPDVLYRLKSLIAQ